MDTSKPVNDTNCVLLDCRCCHCDTPNVAYKIQFLVSNHVLLRAICVRCGTLYWVRHDITKILIRRADEQELEFLAQQAKEAEGLKQAETLGHQAFEYFQKGIDEQTENPPA